MWKQTIGAVVVGARSVEGYCWSPEGDRGQDQAGVDGGGETLWALGFPPS